MNERRWPRVVVPVLAWSLVAASTAIAHHTVFDFQVDRFEVDGGRLGPLDGSPDVVQDFDRGWWFPDWRLLQGTAYERDGFLHLTNPGTHVENGFGALPGTTIDISQVQFSPTFSDGGGSFTATTWWEPQELRLGDYMHFTFVGARRDSPGGAFVYEAVSLSLSNATPEGQPPRYDVTQALVHIPPIDDAGPLRTDAVSIDPAAITGQIIFSLAFDDTTDSAMGSFSLDGGETFQTPFRPQPVFRQTRDGYLIFGVDPLAAEEPVGTRDLCVTGASITHVRLVQRGSATKPYSLSGTLDLSAAGAYDPPRDGAQIAIHQDLTTHAVAPAGGPGSGCDRRDGWTRKGLVSRYRNFSNALPPACTPGSAEGLRWLRFNARRGRIVFRMRPLAWGTLPRAGAAGITVALGADAEARAGRCAVGKTTCRPRGASMRCR